MDIPLVVPQDVLAGPSGHSPFPTGLAGERNLMTHEASFFSGDVMSQNWSDDDGGVAVMAAKKKAAKKKTTKKPAKKKPKPTRRGPGCGTGKKTC